MSQLWASSSTPMHGRPVSWQRSRVVPLPAKGSRMTPPVGVDSSRQQIAHQIERLDGGVVVARAVFLLRRLAAVEESRGPTGVAVGAGGRGGVGKVPVVAALPLAAVALLTGLHLAAGERAGLGAVPSQDNRDGIHRAARPRFRRPERSALHRQSPRPRCRTHRGRRPAQLPRESPRRTVVPTCRHCGWCCKSRFAGQRPRGETRSATLRVLRTRWRARGRLFPSPMKATSRRTRRHSRKGIRQPSMFMPATPWRCGVLREGAIERLHGQNDRFPGRFQG